MDAYNVAVDYVTKHSTVKLTDEHYHNICEIKLLIQQYYYGVGVKEELKNKLRQLKIKFDETN